MESLMLRANIIRSGLTISDIAKGTGIPYSTVRDWLTGETNTSRMTMDKAARLAWYLNITMDELVNGTMLVALRELPSPCKVTRLNNDGESFPILFELDKKRRTRVPSCDSKQT